MASVQWQREPYTLQLQKTIQIVKTLKIKKIQQHTMYAAKLTHLIRNNRKNTKQQLLSYESCHYDMNTHAHVCQTDVGMLKNKTLSAEKGLSLTEDVL